MVYTETAVYSGTVTLAECLTAWLEKTGKKQKAVAKKAGLTPSKISELASGVNPDPQWSTIEKVAKGFDLSAVVFLAGPRPEEESGRATTTVSGGSGFADSLRRAVSDYERSGTVPADWSGDVLIAIFALTRALQRSETSPDVAEPALPDDRRATSAPRGRRLRT